MAIYAMRGVVGVTNQALGAMISVRFSGKMWSAAEQLDAAAVLMEFALSFRQSVGDAQ
uniref:Uncharacterized protein n=1 Tax=Oryza sativa subsp. japonica TaxID=39947 RepID=Q84SN5_ORYSJ|nr:hypothetical protein [Oryza sativa Japonica Group]